jgi:uncharacterized membrane protein
MSEATKEGSAVGEEPELLDESDDLDYLDDPDLLSPAPPRWHRRTATEMIVSGVLGLIASFVLSIEAWQLRGEPNAVFSCDINSVIACGKVARTWQATLLGFPNAFLGIFFETIVLVLSVSILSGVRFPRWLMLGANALYSIGLFFALWLFTQSYFVIHALCPWCLLITFTTTLVWAGLTRINVRDGHLPATAGTRRFVAAGYDWYVTGAFCLLIVVMIVLRYGGALLA